VWRAVQSGGVIEPQLDEILVSGAYGHDHETEQHDDLQAKVLHLLGRDPTWTA